MDEDWYYEFDGETRGPISFEQLLAVLRERPDWRDFQVWCADFDNWRAAKDVHQIAIQFGLRRGEGMPKRAALSPDEAQAQKMPRKKMLWIVGSVGAALLAIAAGGAIMIWQPFTPPLERVFARIIQQTRPALPRKADESTSLMDVISSGTKLTYQHVWDGPRFAIPGNLGALMKARKLADICAAAKEIFNLGGSVEYSYRSQSSLFIASFEVKKEDCG